MRLFEILPREAECNEIVGDALPENILAPFRRLFAEGKVGVVPLHGGDRLLCAKKAILVGKSHPPFTLLTMKNFGWFAVLKEPFILEEGQEALLEAAAGFTPRDRDMTEIIGRALVVGPEDPSDPAKLTPATITQEELDRLICWSAQGVRNKLQAIMDANASVDRDDLTDQELEECGCDECLTELSRRNVKH